MKYFFTLLIIILTSCSNFKPFPHELERITEDGTWLYEYDRACLVATDSLISIYPARIVLGTYFARKLDDKWEVVFGRLSDDSTHYLIAYKVYVDDEYNTEVLQIQPREKDSSFYFKAAMCVAKGFNDASVPLLQRRYNYYVQERDTVLRLYFMPAQTESEAYFLGDDEYLDYHHTNFKLVNRKRMYKSLIVYEINTINEINFTFSHAEGNKLPQPSDVFFVLSKQMWIDHIVYTFDYFYVIDYIGRIKPVKRSQFRNDYYRYYRFMGKYYIRL